MRKSGYMEYFLRHHKRTIGLIFAGILFATFDSGAFSADKKTNRAGLTDALQTQQPNLDFANGLYARKMYGPAIAEYEKFLKHNPDSPDASSARFRYADSLYFSKDYAASIAHFDLFLKEHPQDKRTPVATFRLGTARFYQGNLPRAIRTFVRLSKTAEDPLIRYGAKFYLAKCIEQKGRNEARALSIYEKIVQENPQNEYVSYAGIAIGDSYIKSKDYEHALIGYLAAASNENPAELSRQSKFKVAEIYFIRKDFSAASSFYQRVFEGPSYGQEDDLKGKALLGLFYCDYHTSNLTAAQRRYSENRPFIESSEQRAEITFLMGSFLASQKKYEEALENLDEVISDNHAQDTLKEKAQFKRISVLSEKGDKETSLKELEKVFIETPKSADRALFERAQLLTEIGKTDDAITVYKQLIEGHPGSEYAKDALYRMALVRMKAGRTAEAKQDLVEFAQKYNLDANADLALLQIVQIDLDAEKFQDAFQNAENFISQRPNSPKLDIAYYKLGVAAAGLKRFGHAAVAFQKVEQNFPDSKLVADALYGAAASLENAHKIDESIVLYEKLAQLHPEHSASKAAMAHLGYLYLQQNNFDRALAHYEDLVFNRRDVELDTDGVFWMIQYLLDQSSYERLGHILEALQGRFPDRDLNHEILFFRGESALGMKDYAKAADYYAQSIQANPEGNFVPHALLGQGIAFTAQNKDEEASRSFGEALKYDHEIKIAMRARFELANLFLKTKQWEEAAKAFMLVAILYDDAKFTPPALYKAGECFLAIGKKEDAQKAFAELKSKYPDSEWSAKARNVR